jgi:glycosyltransferase involved in cell wall biosynthesis
VAISSGLRDRLRLAPGFTGPAIVAPSGVELRRFPLSWHGHAAGRSPGPPRAVYVGRLGSWKGIELLIRALPFVPDLELDLVGEGEQKDRAELVNLTSHLGVPGRVRIRGSLAHRDVAAVLADSDVAVHALPGDRSVAARDTSPLKLVEYLAVGVPVVASNVASVREIVTDGKTGILVPAGDAKALATALATVIRNRPLSCQLSTAGRAVAEQRSWDARARKLIPFFEDVLRHHHSGTRT